MFVSKVFLHTKYANIEECCQVFSMCECTKIHLYEVEFKLDGMIVVPTHKNCGFALDEKQSTKFTAELVKSWGIKEDEDE